MATLDAQVHEDLARQAAFLWLFRDRAARDHAYDLASLAALDARLEAHLDGLRLAGDAGWTACRDLLAEPEGGEIFGAAVVAMDGWDLKGLARVLEVGGRAPDLARGLASALGWTPLDRVKKLLPGLLSRKVSPALTWIGITACAVHRSDPGPPLADALLSKEPRVKARALRAVGELGRKDLLPEVRDALSSTEPTCRFWAAWTAALLGEDSAARVLWEVAQAGGAFAERAVSIAMRRMAPSGGIAWIQSLAGSCPDRRVPLAAAAALGDPVIVPWLLEQMQSPETARLAGGAFHLITGVDLEAEKLATRPPEGWKSGPSEDPEDEDVSMDPDGSLPWPDVAGVSDHWRRNGGRFARGARHLLGKRIEAPWLQEVLSHGRQPARAAAALELCVLNKGVLFEVRAPGYVQKRSLGGR